MIKLRNKLYDLSLFKAHRVAVPVLSVGNITVGGTGKTPLVLRIAAEALGRGLRPAVLARGYQGRSDQGILLNDEGILLTRNLPDLILYQHPDRSSSAHKAVTDKQADFLILDDGYQHRRLARSCDLVLIDASRPFGMDRVLPAGLLREPLTGLKRAHAFVLTRCDQVPVETLKFIRDRLDRFAPGTPCYQTIHRPAFLRSLDGGVPLAPDSLEGCSVFYFAAIANPNAFAATLEKLGARVVGGARFPDHHWYEKQDLDSIREQAKSLGAEKVVTTAKDGAKLASCDWASAVWVVEVELSFQSDENRFWEQVFTLGTP